MLDFPLLRFNSAHEVANLSRPSHVRGLSVTWVVVLRAYYVRPGGNIERTVQMDATLWACRVSPWEAGT